MLIHKQFCALIVYKVWITLFNQVADRLFSCYEQDLPAKKKEKEKNTRFFKEIKKAGRPKHPSPPSGERKKKTLGVE